MPSLDAPSKDLQEVLEKQFRAMAEYAVAEGWPAQDVATALLRLAGHYKLEVEDGHDPAVAMGAVRKMMQ